MQESVPSRAIGRVSLFPHLMGILDEAIREHLELKRRHGAPDAELKQLEDEAFGPPTRPGEPDFPEGAEASERSENGSAAETMVVPETAVEAPPAEEPPSEEPPAEVEEPAAEPPAEEHPLVVEAPAPEPSGEAPGAEPEEGTALFDQDAETEPKLEDLDLDLEDQEPVSPEPAPPTSEPPIESLDTVEHAFP